MRANRSGLLLCLGSLLICGLLSGQAKRPLTFADYDSWKTIQSQTISDDGKFVAYALVPQASDAELIVKDAASGREVRVPIGTQPPPPTREDDNGEGGPPPVRGPKIEFSGDGNFLVCQTFPTKADVAAAKKAKKRPEEMPKNGLAVVTLATGAVVRIDSVKSYAVSDDAGGRVAVRYYGKEKRMALRNRGAGAWNRF